MRAELVSHTQDPERTVASAIGPTCGRAAPLEFPGDEESEQHSH